MLFSCEISIFETKSFFLTLDGGMVGSDGCCKQNLVISFQLVKFCRAVNIDDPPTPRNKQASNATKKASHALELSNLTSANSEKNRRAFLQHFVTSKLQL